jgi:selenide,water dikinase
VQRATTPILKDLVLIGGGHSHVAVLKSFGMRPMPGVRVTLISKEVTTPYSGMLPGYIAGHYSFDDAHIDLWRLCHFGNAAFHRATVMGLDLNNKQVLCAGRPPIRFDLLSVNIGSTPSARGIPGAMDHALPVKPIEGLLKGWDRAVQKVLALDQSLWRVAIVGAGAGGVELTLAIQHRLQSLLAVQAGRPVRIEFHLVADSSVILPTHNPRVQAKFACILRERGVQVHVKHRVVEVRPGQLCCSPGEGVPCDIALWVTNAAAPGWIGQAGLRTDAEGFLAVNDCLQSLSHPFVFAAGDVAAVIEHPRPKSGVFAVRQGPPLSENLRRALAGRPLKPFQPQKHFLSLISTGDRYAVASRSGWALEGKWVWRLKNWIDRRWMRQYRDVPDMESAGSISVAIGLADADALKELSALTVRCGGCGAKVGSAILARVLQRLTPRQRDDLVIGLDSPDDAAVTRVPPGQVSVQTVDFFRSFLSDPYLFGRVAAHHSLNDIFAMGAMPQSALAIAVVPFGLEAKMEEQLYQMMAGAVEVLNEHDTALAGGHSTEGAELSFGLVVNGFGDLRQLLRKGGLRAGDQLLLTKPLGTGTLFAADMRRWAKGLWINGALECMLRSNRGAAQCFLRHHATACTDVSGFGLLGHLLEMIRSSSGVGVALRLDTIPILNGAMETIRAGIFSSLQAENERARRGIQNVETAANHERFPILFDPQTAGGLLAGVPRSNAAECLAELRGLGYADAAIIGAVTEGHGDSPQVSLF